MVIRNLNLVVDNLLAKKTKKLCPCCDATGVLPRVLC